MAHAHSHAHRHGPSSVDVARGPVLVLLSLLALVALATVVGVVALWPDSGAVDKLRSQAQYAARGVTFQKATVTRVERTCPTGGDQGGSGQSSDQAGDQPGDQPSCGQIVTRVRNGPDAGSGG